MKMLITLLCFTIFGSKRIFYSLVVKIDRSEKTASDKTFVLNELSKIIAINQATCILIAEFSNNDLSCFQEYSFAKM